jgi:hypothetical protein
VPWAAVSAVQRAPRGAAGQRELLYVLGKAVDIDARCLERADQRLRRRVCLADLAG